MKLHKNISLILIYLNITFGWNRFSPKTSIVSSAIFDIVQEFYIKFSENFEFLIFTEESKEVRDILEKILKRIDNSSVKIRSFGSQQQDIKFNYPTVFLFDNVENFLKFKSTSSRSMQYHRENSKYLVYCQNMIHQDILDFYSQPGVLDIGKKDTDLFMYFIVEHSRKKLELVTLEYFTEKACNKLQLKILNSFNVKTKKWRKISKPLKFKNFHNCMLVEFALLDPNMFFIDKKDGILKGFLVDFTKILETQGNFQSYFEISEYDYSSREDLFYRNYTIYCFKQGGYEMCDILKEDIEERKRLNKKF